MSWNWWARRNPEQCDSRGYVVGEKVYGVLLDILRIGREIRTGQEKTQMDLSTLTAAVQDVQAQDAALTAEVANLKTSVANETTAINQAIADLEAKANAGEPFTQADLDALKNTLTGVSSNLTQLVSDTTSVQAAVDAETATVKAADPGPQAQGPVHGAAG